MKDEIKHYIDSEVISAGKASFKNDFPFTDITMLELEEVFSYLNSQKI